MTSPGADTGSRRAGPDDGVPPPAPVTPSAPVMPSAFVSVRGTGGRLLLVRRNDSGLWELPGGRVRAGESVPRAAVREVGEESGVQVLVTRLVGIFGHPAHVLRSRSAEVRRQFAVVFHARAVGGCALAVPGAVGAAAWTAVADLGRLPLEPASRLWIAVALADGGHPQLI